MARSLSAPPKPRGTSWLRRFEAIGVLGIVGLAAYALGKRMRSTSRRCRCNDVCKASLA
jgi:hypothetical protein